jgi:hypothetical protein
MQAFSDTAQRQWHASHAHAYLLKFVEKMKSSRRFSVVSGSPN